MKSYLFMLIVIFEVSTLTSCTVSESNKNTIAKEHITGMNDTIWISDSVFLILTKIKNEVIITSYNKNKSICDIKFYDNGSLKKIQNEKGSKIVKQNDGIDVEAHNFQILELNKNGFVNHYCVTRNFELVEENFFSDSL